MLRLLRLRRRKRRHDIEREREFYPRELGEGRSQAWGHARYVLEYASKFTSNEAPRAKLGT